MVHNITRMIPAEEGCCTLGKAGLHHVPQIHLPYTGIDN